MSSVLQEWVTKMPWKCQSILFSGLRGPDTGYSQNVKEVSRWMRKVVQHDADPSQSYMSPWVVPNPEDLEKELEFSTCHFVHHFADALRCIAIFHPDEYARAYAKKLHDYIADELFHFVPETDEVFIYRHRDRVEHE